LTIVVGFKSKAIFDTSPKTRIMKHLILFLTLTASASFAFAQSPVESKGIQAAEENAQVPHEMTPNAPLIQDNSAAPRSMDATDLKAERKHALRDFLITRAAKKLQKALPASVAKDAKVHGVIYVLLVVLLVLLILSLLQLVLPLQFWNVLVLVLLIVLLLALLGAI
jgi:hypothetical protein